MKQKRLDPAGVSGTSFILMIIIIAFLALTSCGKDPCQLYEITGTIYYTEGDSITGTEEIKPYTELICDQRYIKSHYVGGCGDQSWIIERTYRLID
jgi:hypothetical protein